MKYPPVQYHDYLHLDKILDSQKRRSSEFNNPAHDEMLFIIVHQTYELWFKQILFELDSVIECFHKNKIPESEMGVAVARLERVIDIQKLINGQVDVLETMTPLDFLEFRDYLYPASGFQSFQWRLIETKLGLKSDFRLNYNQSPFYSALTADQQTHIRRLIEQPSLYDLIEKWLERTPFLQTDQFTFWSEYKKSVLQMLADDEEVISSNPRLGPEAQQRSLDMMKQAKETFLALFDPESYKKLQEQNYFRLSQKAVHAALFIQIYRDQPMLALPFRLLACLQDIDEKMTEWRHRHSIMVHRMIGKKIGTGGSSGHDYLKATTEKHKIFTDFFNLSTFFIPRSKIPQLPQDLESRLNFQN